MGIRCSCPHSSDYYYTKLERDYPILEDFQKVEGRVTDLRVHWNCSYLTIDTKQRVMIRQTENEKYEVKGLDDLIEVGDSIYKDGYSDEIKLKKGGVVYRFRNYGSSFVLPDARD